MRNSLMIALRTYAVAFVLLGLGFPLLVTGVAQLTMSHRANGSLVTGDGGAVVGSELVGQSFSSAEYFHSRPSAGGYDPMASGGTNLGPTNRDLAESVGERVAKVRAEDPSTEGRLPVDMITSSASGLDPHISPANALAQVSRVARARNLDEDQVRDLVLSRVQGRDLGFIGEPRVNLLALNRALDALDGVR
jgi:K+-transporting ATPase ATPase C chain